MSARVTGFMTDQLVALTKQAGRLLKKNLKQNHAITYKGNTTNLVTEMDQAVEKIFIKAINHHFPKHDILSEEMVEKDGHPMPTQPYRQGTRWIIDPLDGTTNYAHGFPHFCVSAAIEINGRVQLGAVYNPMLDEFFFTKRGRGAWLNNQPIKVSTTSALSLSLLATGFPYDFNSTKTNNVDHFYRLSGLAQAIRRAGAAALDLCDVACGRFDGFWEMKLKPWDVAAGALMIEEAGGRCSNFNGRPLNIYRGAVAASNGKNHKKLIEILKKGRH